ncbi:unnamed protein product [Cylicocyclus nassatus]|uniref:Uncharacterized protein n=1 Tax=Cylicocyclus nassatus TaxID=53992 RepID=A0AA36H5R7_CYLNA|nr:unnamed protein product [Cylicocyclus nassatus]
MPTFGLLDDDDDDEYIGHEDLQFKRYAFPSVQPLDRVLSAALHTTLSRLFREKSQSPEKKDLHGGYSFSKKPDFSSPSSNIIETRSLERGSSPEEIAQYYIERARKHSEEEPKERVVVISNIRFPKKLPVVAAEDRIQEDHRAEINVDHHVKVVEPTTVGNAVTSPNAATSKLPNSLEECYPRELKLAEGCDKAKKMMEENKEQKSIRVLTKRTIIEKVTVESKRTANEEGIRAVAEFFIKLFTGTQVIGYGDKNLQLPRGGPILYAYIVTIESYMGIVERDPLLADVISQILIEICEGIPDFESLLLGKLLRSSQLLSLNEEKCLAFTEQLATADDIRSLLDPETTAIKLFIHLHIVGLSTKKISHFNAESLWRVLSLLTKAKVRPFATAAILLELVETGSDHLLRLYQKRWSEIFKEMASVLAPGIQAAVNESEVRKNAGEDIILSSLRHAISRHSPNALVN